MNPLDSRPLCGRNWLESMIEFVEAREAFKREPHSLPMDWNWSWLDEVFAFVGGAQPPASEFVGSPAPGVVRFVQIRDYYSNDHLTFVPESSSLRKCSPHDVMIARYGASLGRICRGIEGAYNVALVKTVPKEGIDNNFLFYLLQTEYFQASVRGQGARSAQAGFNKDGLRNILLPIPSPGEQAAIAEVLGALDDKIAGNRAMIRSLDKLAGAIVRSYMSLTDVQSLSEIAAVTMGSSPPGVSYNTAGDGVVFYQGTREFQFRYPRNRMWTTQPLRFASAGDTLVSVRAPVGELNLAGESTCVGRGLAAVHSTRRAPATLFHLLKNADNVWDPFESNGTVFGSINRSQLESLQLPILVEADLNALEEVVSGLELQLKCSTMENETLADVRDTLLPQLVSGKLRVKDAEKQVEAVV